MKKTQAKRDQNGFGAGEKAYKYFNENKDELLRQVVDNPDVVFQSISNAQRFVRKNIQGDTKPIRYLKRGEIHLPSHNFTGPGTRVDLPEVRDFQPYNSIDACSKVHDLRYEKAFKMPKGMKRQNIIRDADKKAVKCYSQFPNVNGYRLAMGGINSKMLLEDVAPSTFDKIVGEAYRGAEVQEQEGGSIDPVAAAYVTSAASAALLYGEYRLGKYMYDRYRP